ncbi:metallophosphoesterase family protein [Paenibacillus hodogayensis]|uniref:Metallophosphoesterase family protein n=1 Tax=Paenibacillus hodogayensis TaxID=279208 RepID=A0ABV5W307_9BACL
MKNQDKGMQVIVPELAERTTMRPWFGEPMAPQGEDFSFVILGDRTGAAVPGVFEQALALTKRLRPDFVVSVGDLVEGYWTSEAEAHEEWDVVDALIRDLNIPFFQTVGNHDFAGETMVKVWRERKGLTYYAIRVREVLFLISNTESGEHSLPENILISLQEMNRMIRREPHRYTEALNEYMEESGWTPPANVEDYIIGSIEDAQIDFFEKLLRENEDVRWTFVVMHQPLWKKEYASFKRLQTLLAGRKHTIFAGHLHFLEATNVEGSLYIQVGKSGGSGLRDSHRVLWVRMRDGVPHFLPIKLDGVDELE